MASPKLRELARESEAAATLLAARAAIAVLPFRWLEWLFARPPRRELDGEARAVARRNVRQAVHRASLRVPGAVCFPRAIAAQSMLRRRGVGTVMYWGVSGPDGGGRKAHVWVKDGEEPVAGVAQSEQYRPLAVYVSQQPTRRRRWKTII